jgi:hypothetical protein
MGGLLEADQHIAANATAQTSQASGLDFASAPAADTHTRATRPHGSQRDISGYHGC